MRGWAVTAFGSWLPAFGLFWRGDEVEGFEQREDSLDNGWAVGLCAEDFEGALEGVRGGGVEGWGGGLMERGGFADGDGGAGAPVFGGSFVHEVTGEDGAGGCVGQGGEDFIEGIGGGAAVLEAGDGGIAEAGLALEVGNGKPHALNGALEGGG